MNEKELLDILKEANDRVIKGEISLDFFMGFYEGFRIVYQMWKKSVRERD